MNTFDLPAAIYNKSISLEEFLSVTVPWWSIEDTIEVICYLKENNLAIYLLDVVENIEGSYLYNYPYLSFKKNTNERWEEFSERTITESQKFIMELLKEDKILFVSLSFTGEGQAQAF